MKLNWIRSFNAVQIEEVLNLMKNEVWCKDRTRDQVRRVIEKSTISLAAIDRDESVVCFARILTDFTFKATIYDVIVRQDWRNKGLGKEIIGRIKNLKELDEVQSFELYCPDRLNGFYESLGFRKSIANLLVFRP